MAEVKVFISSTCYDLSIIRSELRNFIKSMGHIPVMSDYADVLYDPRTHTHTSCVSEVANCDMLIVIIGSRFGGISVPEAIDAVNTNDFEDTISNTSENKISITQLEVLKAIECNIPIYAFIDNKVYYQHELYEKNKDNNAIIDNIVFPSIEKPELAKYIFNFIDYIRHRAKGNSYFPFEKLQDIEDVLKKQWSSYFQRLLLEQRTVEKEQKQIDVLNEQFENLKAAIIASIGKVDSSEIASGIVQYRRLAEFLFGLNCEPEYLYKTDDNFKQILDKQGIVKISNFFDIIPANDYRGVPYRTLLLAENGTFFDCRYSINFIDDLEKEWDKFKTLPEKTKKIIITSLRGLYRPGMYLRYHPEYIEDFIQKIQNRNYRHLSGTEEK